MTAPASPVAHPDQAARAGCTICTGIDVVRFERGARTVAPFCSACGRRFRVVFVEVMQQRSA